MRQHRGVCVRTIRTLAVPVVLAACGSDVGPTSNLQVSNNVDDFTLVAQTFERVVNDSLVYTWQHTGTVAEVTQDTRITAGSATLTIRDAAGTQVYTHDLAESGTFPTTAGASGSWSLQVVFKRLLGDVFFTVKKVQ